VRRIKLASIAAAASLAIAGLVAPVGHTASLDSTQWVAAANGLVGVQQTVLVRAPQAKGSVVTVTFVNDLAGSNSGQTQVNAQGFAYLPWMPDLPGSWTISAEVGTTTVSSTSLMVAAMPTKTTLLVAGEVRANRSNSLIAEVQALGGSIIPSGTVSVRDQTGTVVTQGTVVPSEGTNTAQVEMAWVPEQGSPRLAATFTPATPAFTASVSPSQSPVVGGPQAVSLRLPPVVYLGIEESLEAIIQPDYLSSLGGSVAFNLSIDGFRFDPMGGSQPIGNGVGSVKWAPTQVGYQTVGVGYASANFGINGKDRQVINVQPAPQPDAITVTPAVEASLPVGSTVSLNLTAESSNPVRASTDGPCAIDGTDLTILGPGECTIIAQGLGNGGSLTASTQAFSVTAIS